MGRKKKADQEAANEASAPEQDEETRRAAEERFRSQQTVEEETDDEVDDEEEEVPAKGTAATDEAPVAEKPTLQREQEALLESSRTPAEGDDPEAGKVDLGDPRRAPAAGETAANVRVLEAKGDLAPMPPTPDQVEAALMAPEPTGEGDKKVRRFTIMRGQVGVFKASGEGQEPLVVTFEQLQIPEDSVDRLTKLGVIAPVE